MDITKLKKFHGYQSSIIAFSSQYYFYFNSWDSSPTNFSLITNIWLITPDNHRILFSDPPETSSIVCIYHDFDEIIGASISIDWITEDHLMIHCKSNDDHHNLEVEFQVKETLSSKILISIAGGPPTLFKVSKPMVKLTNFLVNKFIVKSGSAIVGTTETGQPFYHGNTEKVYLITQGSGSYNNKDLGSVSEPTWPITFGDSGPYKQPIIKLGNLYVQFEPEVLSDHA